MTPPSFIKALAARRPAWRFFVVDQREPSGIRPYGILAAARRVRIDDRPDAVG